MQQIIVIFFIAAALLIAVKVAVILLVVAFFVALIMRPRETLGLLLVSAIIGGFAAHPVIGIVLLVTAISVGRYFKKKHERAEAAQPLKRLPRPD